MNDCFDKIKATVRAELLSCLDEMQIEHKVSVNQVLESGRALSYKDEDFSLKSAKLTRKTDKTTGAYYYELKAVVEG